MTDAQLFVRENDQFHSLIEKYSQMTGSTVLNYPGRAETLIEWFRLSAVNTSLSFYQLVFKPVDREKDTHISFYLEGIGEVDGCLVMSCKDVSFNSIGNITLTVVPE